MAKTDLKAYLKFLPIVFLVILTLWLRLANLGYSDYQGDEIKAKLTICPKGTFLRLKKLDTELIARLSTRTVHDPLHDCR